MCRQHKTFSHFYVPSTVSGQTDRNFTASRSTLLLLLLVVVVVVSS